MASSLFLRNIPTIKEREFKYRGRMDSSELNQMQDEAFGDILDLFNKANEMQREIHETKELYMIESECYAIRLANSNKRQKELEEAYQNVISNTDFRYLTAYANDAIVVPDEYAAIVDHRTNDVTAATVSTKSKTRLYDATYNEYLVPDSLQVSIGPDSFLKDTNVLSVEDSDIKKCFDGNLGSAWLRKVTTNRSVSYIENEIVIGLPEDIITTRAVNEIVIAPFPSGYVDIMDIQFKNNGAWTTIPSFRDHTLCTEKTGYDIFGNAYTYWSIDNAPDVKFCFNEVQSSQLKIKLRQRNFFDDAENSRRTWYIGLRNVDVIYNSYTNDYSEFAMVYDFPETERNIKVYDASIVFNNLSQSNDSSFGVTKEYYYYDADGKFHKIASTAPFILDGHKLRIKFTIEGGQKSPNIYSCTVKYKLA